jgi:hypothetical protein
LKSTEKAKFRGIEITRTGRGFISDEAVKCSEVREASSAVGGEISKI